jgi:uncharacterized protein YeeX (DUF496 family)
LLDFFSARNPIKDVEIKIKTQKRRLLLIGNTSKPIIDSVNRAKINPDGIIFISI